MTNSLTTIPSGSAAFTVHQGELLAGRLFHVHGKGWDWKFEWSDDNSTVLSTKQVATLARRGRSGGTTPRPTHTEALEDFKKALASQGGARG